MHRCNSFTSHPEDTAGTKHLDPRKVVIVTASTTDFDKVGTITATVKAIHGSLVCTSIRMVSADSWPAGELMQRLAEAFTILMEATLVIITHRIKVFSRQPCSTIPMSSTP